MDIAEPALDVEMQIEGNSGKAEQDGIKSSEALTQQQNGGNGSQNSMKHDPKDLKDHEQSRSITLPL